MLDIILILWGKNDSRVRFIIIYYVTDIAYTKAGKKSFSTIILYLNSF